MNDLLTPQERSERMSLVRAKDTKPELLVRRLVYSMGYKYRLHVRDLPGCPDLTFRGRRKLIFVHGCFWHQHNCRMGNRMPKSSTEFWTKKLEGNKKRDTYMVRRLKADGWAVLIIWECQLATRDSLQLGRLIKLFLGPL